MSEDTPNPKIAYKDLDKEVQVLLRETHRLHQISRDYHEAHFGYTLPIMSVDAYGQRIVTVGGNFLTSDNPDVDWETPSDFLVSYLKSRLGLDWFSKQTEKKHRDQHEIMKWYRRGIPNIGAGSADKWHQPNGKAIALLHLAYDIYVLENINMLPEGILERLKDGPNFNGARYELFVFATMVRAGFEIEYSDEKSGKNGRVPEGRVIHKQSGQAFYIEAKTRNIKHVLGSKQGNARKVRLYHKLKSAMAKNVDGPYVIFVDINHPNIEVKKGEYVFERVREEYRKFEESYKNSMPNLVCFTNIPFHYGADDCSPEQNLIGHMISRSPKYLLDDPNTVFLAIDAALKKYNFLPKEFGESDKYSRTVLKKT